MRVTLNRFVLVVSFLLVGACSPDTPSTDHADTSSVGEVDMSIDGLTLAAGQGDAQSQRLLGNEYFTGGRVEQDYAKAKELFVSAADQGDAKALHNLGVMYYGGDGVDRDYTIAREWYTKAAELGLMEAQYNLGIIYYNGDGVELDRSIAKTWFDEACKSGSDDGCHAYQSVASDEVERSAIRKPIADDDDFLRGEGI